MEKNHKTLEKVYKNFTEFLNSEKTKRYSRYKNKETVFNGKLNRTTHDLPKEPVPKKQM